MPRYLYGGSYDSIASQEMARDAARDQRYFQSIAASQRLRQQMEDELYRKAQFEAVQRQADAQLSSQNQARNLQALLQLQGLRADQQRNMAIDERANRQLGLTESAQRAAERRFQAQQALREREQALREREPNHSRQMVSPANLIAIAKMAADENKRAISAQTLAELLNKREELLPALDAADVKDPNRKKLRDELNLVTSRIYNFDKGATAFVRKNEDGLFEATYQPSDITPESVMQTMAQMYGYLPGRGGGTNTPPVNLPMPASPTNAPAAPPTMPTVPAPALPAEVPGGRGPRFIRGLTQPIRGLFGGTAAPAPAMAPTNAPPAVMPSARTSKLPPGLTEADIIRDAQEKITEGYDPATIAKQAWETFGVRLF